MGDLYVLHVLIVTGIFIIAAMSLNLLLGYTGQLSLGHVAFFGIGAYVSSLVSLGFEVHLLPRLAGEPGAQAGLARHAAAASSLAGLERLGDRQALLQGARRLFRHRLGQLRRGGAPGRAQLGGADAGARWRSTTSRRCGSAFPACSSCTSCASPPTTGWCWPSRCCRYVLIRRLVRSRAGRAMIALRENEPLATSVGVDVTQLPGAGDHDLRRDGRRGRRALRPLRAHRRPGRVPVHLHGDDGDHGDQPAARARWPAPSSAG